MRFLSSLGTCLSLVSGFLFLALLAELYYVFLWKKRSNRGVGEDDYSGSAREPFHLFCAGRPSSLGSIAVNPQEIRRTAKKEDEEHPDSTKEMLAKPVFEEECLESEFMRLHNLCGPPRILFTIKEETKEDLESEDGGSRRAKSRKGSLNDGLADVLFAVETTPFGTPLLSPPVFAPSLTPLDYYRTKSALSNAFNPLFESSTGGESIRFVSSPPPTFKFLRDAEEKLMRKLVETGKIRTNCGPFPVDKAASPNGFSDECALPTESGVDGSIITIVIDQDADANQPLQQPVSGSTQVFPLESSPPEKAKPGKREPV